MGYELQLKPFEQKDGLRYKVIQITDIALHTNKMRATPSIGKKFKQSFDSNRPGRIYSPIVNQAAPEQKVTVIDLLKKDPEFTNMILEEEKKGFKVLIAFPNEGIPIFPGKDTVEFINSTKGQRIIRRMTKEEGVH